LATRISIPPSVLFRDLGGEAVVLDLESGCYYGLDEVGTRIWNLLGSHGDMGRIEAALLAEYDVDREQLAGDLTEFVRSLAEQGLLAVQDEKTSPVVEIAVE
jgi:Coenzyme PQQ synthesis protein D (PqqD)